MFETSNLIVFMIATVTLNITPGPDLLFVATRSVGQGPMAGVVSALGISVGTIFHTLCAAFGLSAILSYSALAFQIVKWAGAAYLIYLGIKTLRSGASQWQTSKSAPLPLRKIFTQGVITNILNPKVALFFLAFLPQFVNHNSPKITLQILALGALFNISGTTVCMIVALICGYAGAYLLERPRFWRYQRWFTGSVFIAMGARLAFADKK